MKWLLLLALALEASAQRFRHMRTATQTPKYHQDARREAILFGPLKLVGLDVRLLV
jgi:hypothetical protein